jgi:hypothetical protein
LRVIRLSVAAWSVAYRPPTRSFRAQQEKTRLAKAEATLFTSVADGSRRTLVRRLDSARIASTRSTPPVDAGTLASPACGGFMNHVEIFERFHGRGY